MRKVSLCLEPVLPEFTIYDRIKAAADVGYSAVEFWDPSAYDVKKFASTAAKCGVAVAGCTLSEPRVYQLDKPAKPVMENIVKSIDIAKELGCKTLIGLSSDIKGRFDSQKNIIIDNLKRSAELAEKNDITLVLEPLNSLVDHKGTYLDTSLVGFEIAKCVNSPNVKILFDIYHMQIMEGNIISNISENIDLIGHFHSACVPGRNEPMLGESNYKVILKKIDELGYDKYIGLEYWPTYDHKKSMKDCLEYMAND
jgi:hydroxypyruvate isomerase